MSAFHCRACGCLEGRMMLDLGNQPLANNLLCPEDLERPEPRFPLRLFVCPECWLMQLTDLVPPVKLFSEYLYFSSYSDTMLRHAQLAAARYIDEFRLKQDSLVVEIASNDGYLLRNFRDARIPCLGIEPAANIAKVARAQGIETVVDFFDSGLAKRLAGEGRQADLILGNNVFAHVPTPNDFVLALKSLLKPHGRAILEFPHGLEFLEQTEFDTVYHEHVFYFTLTALTPLFARHGMEICDVEQLPIHGGSLRIFVRHASDSAPKPPTPSLQAWEPPELSPAPLGGKRQAEEPGLARVAALLALEQSQGIASLIPYDHFAAQVAGIKRSLIDLLTRIQADGKTVAAYGASAKGSTLLNYCGLNHDHLAFVVDRSTYKQGRLTPGTHIPIEPVDELARRRPDYTLLLTWNFADEILNQQQAYRDAGGRFIIPIPELRIV